METDEPRKMTTVKYSIIIIIIRFYENVHNQINFVDIVRTLHISTRFISENTRKKKESGHISFDDLVFVIFAIVVSAGCWVYICNEE